MRKLLGVEHDQRTQEFGLGLLGAGGRRPTGTPAQWTFGFLANRCLTIAGGTSEVQRNVIAERLLGLPRDPSDFAPGRRGARPGLAVAAMDRGLGAGASGRWVW